MKYDGSIESDYEKIGVDRKEFDNGELKFEDYFSVPPMFFTKDLANVPCINRYNGGHAFLIASGPSFSKIDKSKLCLPGVLTMGINNSPASFRPNLWTCVDTPSSFLASVWLDPIIEKIVPISHIEKKLFDSEKWKDINTKVGDCPNVIYYRRNEVVNTSQYCFEDTINWGNHSKIHGGRSVLLAAMRILFLLGIRNVYLLGVDFKMDKNNKYHFPQDRNNGSINGNNSTYKSMNKWFKKINEYFKLFGHKVYNCNKNSMLTAFPFIDFDEAIKLATKHMPMNEKTDGMYTRRSDKEKEKEKRKAALEAEKYTEEERVAAKEELNRARADLDKAKENKYNILSEIFPNNHKECYLWAHKLQPPTGTPEMMKLYNVFDEVKNKSSKPDDEVLSKLYDAEANINNKRKEFKDVEAKKNKIWGIVK